MSSPSLNPSGFIEFEGCHMDRTRSQPSRESAGITQLNDVIAKYATRQYRGGDFLELASMLKWMSKSWARLPDFAKRDLIRLIVESNSGLAKESS